MAWTCIAVYQTDTELWLVKQFVRFCVNFLYLVTNRFGFFFSHITPWSLRRKHDWKKGNKPLRQKNRFHARDILQDISKPRLC